MSELLSAVALVLVIEGLLPFLSPDTYKRAITEMLQVPSINLRWFGLAMMIGGVVLLYFVRKAG